MSSTGARGGPPAHTPGGPTIRLPTLALALAAADPLACQPNDEFPMLPTYHLIGNVTKSGDGAIKLEPINDVCHLT